MSSFQSPHSQIQMGGEPVSEPERRLKTRLAHNLGSLVLDSLNDENVVEVLLNPDGRLWVDKFGSGLKPRGQLSRENGELAISLMASSLKSTVTPERPIVEGELPLDGSRFEGLMPPVVAGPAFAIRKKATRIFSLGEYVRDGILPPDCLDIISEAIKMHRNILVVGGTGSGKTTFVNAIIRGMADLCPDDRLVIIEDTAELQAASENVVILRTSDFVSIQRLVEATMRLRPDRILVGEVRNGAALDLLKAWNTGHPGGVATIHANSAKGGLKRLEQLIAEVSLAPMRELVAEAIDLVVFIKRSAQGRRIEEMAEVDFDEASGQYTLHYHIRPSGRAVPAAN
jgi:type IV secretion system protein VirB11